jgi:hypothetical protein
MTVPEMKYDIIKTKTPVKLIWIQIFCAKKGLSTSILYYKKAFGFFIINYIPDFVKLNRNS